MKCSFYRPSVAQRVGRGIALLFHDCGTRRGWVVSSTSRPHFTPGKDTVPTYRRLGGPQGQSGRAENLVPTGQSRTVQPVISHYTNWATRSTHYHRLLTLIICHSRPNTRCGLPFAKSWASMLIMLHPMACDENSARVKFSCFVYKVRFFLLIARSSIVSGHEWLMILLKQKSRAHNPRKCDDSYITFKEKLSCLQSTVSEWKNRKIMNTK